MKSSSINWLCMNIACMWKVFHSLTCSSENMKRKLSLNNNPIIFSPNLSSSFLQLLNCEIFRWVQYSSVAQSCLTLWDPMNRNTPGLLVHHKLPEFTQTLGDGEGQRSLRWYSSWVAKSRTQLSIWTTKGTSGWAGISCTKEGHALEEPRPPPLTFSLPMFTSPLSSSRSTPLLAAPEPHQHFYRWCPDMPWDAGILQCPRCSSVKSPSAASHGQKQDRTECRAPPPWFTAGQAQTQSKMSTHTASRCLIGKPPKLPTCLHQQHPLLRHKEVGMGVFTRNP